MRQDNPLKFSVALAFAIIALLTSIIWIYYIALNIALPAGLLSLGLWSNIHKTAIREIK